MYYTNIKVAFVLEYFVIVIFIEIQFSALKELNKMYCVKLLYILLYNKTWNKRLVVNVKSDIRLSNNIYFRLKVFSR